MADGQIKYQVGFDIQKSGLNQLKSSLQQLQKMKIGDIMKINDSDTASARQALMNIKTQALNVETALTQAFNPKLNTVNIEAFNRSLKQSGTSIQQVYSSFRQAGTAGQNAFRSLSSSVLSSNIQLRETHSLLDRMATTLTNTIKWNAASAAINGITRSVQQAWGFTKSLDTSLNNIRIVTGQSAQEMENFAVKANNAAQSLGKTTTDYTNAALIYAQQGLSQQQIEKRAEITLKVASVTGQSTDAVSEQLTAVWNGYKVSADEAELYVDRLAAVAANTASNLEELSTGMSKVASAANTMGVSEEQLAAQLSTMISATRESPETIGTSLKTVYARISDIKAGLDEQGVTLGNYSGQMEAFGIHVLDVNGNLRDMGEVFEEIGGKWNSFNREQQISLAQTMAGQRQYSRLIALFDNFDQYNRALAIAQNATGTLQQQQDTYMESINAHLNTLKGAVEGIYMSLGDTDFINTLIDGLSDVARLTSSAVEGWGGGVEVLKTLGIVGLSTFSEHIAKGINTTITNMEIARSNAQQFSQTLEATKTWQGIPGLDKLSKDLLNSRQQLLELARIMSPEQFSGMQTLLNDIGELGNKLAIFSSQKDILTQAIKDVTTYKDGWKDLNAILNDDSAQEKIINRIKQQENAFKDIADELNKYEERLKQLSTASLSGDDFSQKFSSMKQDLEAYLAKLREMADEGALKQHTQEVVDLENQLSKIDDSIDSEQAVAKLQQIAGHARGIAKDTGTQMGTVGKQLEAGFNETFTNIDNGYQKTLDSLKQKKGQFEASLNVSLRGMTLKYLTDTASGIASIGMAIQQVQRIGSIWNNKDLSTSEKMLQIITTAAFTLPMLISGIQKIIPVLKASTAATIDQTNAQIAHTGAVGATVVAEGAEATSAGAAATAEEAHAAAATKATIAQKLLNATLLINPFTAAIAVVAALTAAFLGLSDAAEQAAKKARQAQIATNDEALQLEQQKRDAIQKNNELMSELQDLDTQFKNGRISRQELKTAVENLTTSYGLERSQIDTLISTYGSLATAIKEVRKQNAVQLKASLETSIETAGMNFQTQAVGSKLGQLKDNKYTIQIADSNIDATMIEAIQDVFTKYGFDMLQDWDVDLGLGNLNGQLSIDATNEGFSQLFVALDQIVKYMQSYSDTLKEAGILTYDIAKKSDFYQQAKVFLDSTRSYYEIIKKNQEQLDQVNVFIDMLEKAEDQMDATTERGKQASENKRKVYDFSQVKSVQEYADQMALLIDTLNQMKEDPNYNIEDPQQTAKNWVREYAKNIYDKYQDYVDYFNHMTQILGEQGASQEVQNLLYGLDEDHFIKLLNFDQSRIKGWNDFKNVLQYISSLDFSNVENLAKTGPMDPEQAKAVAGENYTFYQSLQDQVRGGKTISSKERERLEPQLQSMFTMMANGSYKMTDDAEKFYTTVHKFKMQGFYDAVRNIEGEIERLKTISSDSRTFQQLSTPAYQNTQFSPEKTWESTLSRLGGKDPVFVFQAQEQASANRDLLLDQLDYLEEYNNEATGITQKQIEQWRDAVKGKTELTHDEIKQIAEANQLLGDRTQDTLDKINQLEEAAKSVNEQIYDALFPTDEDVDLEQLASLTETIQSIASQSDELADSLETNSRAAQDIAESILRFDDAVQDVVDNYDDWMAALNSGSIQQQTQAMDGLRDAYADLLDMDGSGLSDEFLSSAENLDLMKSAIDGDIDAYNQLLENAGQQILTDVGLDTQQFFADRDMVQNAAAELAGMDFDDIKIGAELNDTNFLNALTNMVNAAGMTAEQATDYLSSMGVDAEVIQQDTSATEESQQTGMNVRAEERTGQISFPLVAPGSSDLGPIPQVLGQNKATWRYDAMVVEPQTETATATKENKAFALQVTSAKKSSGGNFKFKQSSNGGGSKGAARRSSGSGGKSGGGGKGGSGGSGGSSTPDNSQKELKKALEDERDIYHDINIQLQQINRQLDRTQEKQDRLYGKKLLQNLNEQTKILEKHKQKLRQKQKIQEKDLQQQQKTLKNLGVTFNKYGDISNYMSILQKKQKEVNNLIEKQNELIKQYNAETDKDTKKTISDQISAASKETKQAEDALKKLQDKIKDYDDLREDMQDLVDDIEEETQKQVEINISKFRMRVEIRLELGQAERDWNAFRREVLQHTDVLKGTEFESIYKDANRDLADLTSYFNIGGKKGTLKTLTQQLTTTREEIEKIDQIGASAIYGDNKAQAMEDLKADLQELMNQLQDAQKLIDSIDQAYLKTIDDIKEQFDDQIDDYEYIEDLISHDIDLLGLLYGEKNFDAMEKYYSTLAENNLDQVESLRLQRDFWQKQWELARQSGDTNAAKKFEENFKDAVSNLNQAIENSVKNLQDKYVNSINKIFDTLDKKISNQMGTDYLSTEWDLMNKNADEYLDTINAAFAVQDIQRKYQQAVDETSSIKNQRALKDLMEEQVSLLQNKEKLTQYDVDRAEKLLQIEQARIALEDAQAAKTSMRLKRDSQGNYSYEYVADNAAIDEAEKNLADARNDLYNFDKQEYKQNLSDTLAAWRDFQSEYKSILLDSSLTEEERQNRLKLLREQYGEYINNKTKENLVIRKNLTDSAFEDLAYLYGEDVKKYQSMVASEKQILMNQLVPMWTSGIQQMSTAVAGEGGFIPVTKDAFTALDTETKKYETSLSELQGKAKTNFSNMKKGIDSTAEALQALITDNQALNTSMETEIETIRNLNTEMKNLVSKYEKVAKAAKDAAEETHNFIKAQDLQAAKAAEKQTNKLLKSESGGKKGTKNNNDEKNKAIFQQEQEDLVLEEDTKGNGKKNNNSITDDQIEGIAGNIWLYGSWGDGTDRYNNLIAKFGKKKGKALYNAIQAKFSSGYGYSQDLAHDWNYYKKYSMSSFKSGGYTGNWIGGGRLALLHQRELVLNEQDTQNLLNTMHIMRSVMSSLGGTISSKLGDIRSGFSNILTNNSNSNIDQNVRIEASFPNVNSKKEIEDVFNELINLAAQKALKR